MISIILTWISVINNCSGNIIVLALFDKVYDIWCNIANELEAKGLFIESEFPNQLANECKNKLSNK